MRLGDKGVLVEELGVGVEYCCFEVVLRWLFWSLSFLIYSLAYSFYLTECANFCMASCCYD